MRLYSDSRVWPMIRWLKWTMTCSRRTPLDTKKTSGLKRYAELCSFIQEKGKRYSISKCLNVCITKRISKHASFISDSNSHKRAAKSSMTESKSPFGTTMDSRTRLRCTMPGGPKYSTTSQTVLTLHQKCTYTIRLANTSASLCFLKPQN